MQNYSKTLGSAISSKNVSSYL
ncbi:MAG: hypothetical protein EOP52_09560 [Sphingobacteriales bacterium]|nr:MAG: hypothetical protein EOP52_09560 [Sphingobacteriales bacterium]